MRKPRAPKKPRFPVRLRPHHFLDRVGCYPLDALKEIDEYIRHYDIRGARLHEAASDVLDGWARKDELRPFFSQKLLTMVRHGGRDCPGPEFEDDCGHRWTVYLTDRAIRIFWPDRLDSVAAS